MKDINCDMDMWGYLDRKGFIICITTNGFIKNDGTGVMGAGCAKQAADLFPDLPRLLGISLVNRGNVVSSLTSKILAFPVKHNWFDKADLKLIKKSAKELNKRALEKPHLKFILPRPGCGNGKLRWDKVKPVIDFLPDNVIVVTNEKNSSH